MNKISPGHNYIFRDHCAHNFQPIQVTRNRHKNTISQRIKLSRSLPSTQRSPPLGSHPCTKSTPRARHTEVFSKTVPKISYCDLSPSLSHVDYIEKWPHTNTHTRGYNRSGSEISSRGKENQVKKWTSSWDDCHN